LRDRQTDGAGMTQRMPGGPPRGRRGRAALLLDLDKTLVNVEDGIDYCAALDELRARLPGVVGEVGVETSWGRCTRPVIGLLGALAGTPDSGTASDIVERFEVAGVERSRAMPGLTELLSAIDPARAAIVTLLGPLATEATIERHLAVRPAVVVARAPTLRPKPAPDQALEALRRLGASPADALMIGDSEVDEATAVAAGVTFAGVTNRRPDHRFSRDAVVMADLHEVAAWLRGTRWAADP
jgi:phosphoglycolate phosphatase-like HAD superfamily hydrolase